MVYSRIHNKLTLSLVIILFIGVMFVNIDESSDKIENQFLRNNKKDSILVPMGATSTNNPLNLTGYHNKIYIDPLKENKNFGDCDDLSGRGTLNNPYILENLVIDSNGEGSGIYIENVQKYLIIRNCTIFNSGHFYQDAGITIIRSNYVKIIQCNTVYNHKGIFSAHTKYNQIINCNITNNRNFGWDSYNNQFLELIGNNVSFNAEIGLYYYRSYDGLVKYNYIANNQANGMNLYEMTNTVVHHNMIINNGEIGLRIGDMMNNTAHHNNISRNAKGIELWGSTSENHIYANNIFDNELGQAIDRSRGSNYWDNGTHGNYWGDYLVYNPYSDINGSFWQSPYKVNHSKNADIWPSILPFEINFDFNYIAPQQKSITGTPSILLIFTTLGISVIVITNQKKKQLRNR
ncbi:nitrous oxide reductase family maturation protein NosD [Candidatus Lokiarchaeum ossiferum]|uniref:nitrous oxide reductase family maturation protein NosD n=1 Tax=Candidatus Lokiarchaeum ossiferum TaxID=2951803 RepID=UPI00352E2838